ncbi:flagellar hook-length control protein FliK [Thalassospira australica]|uniref:flagellar hook-length control protein FliK n=1 Tax=Thalassospira australica TaxID=1528106 RepID=UPI0038516CBB
MNSSAIIRSASPTISIPGQTGSVSSDVSFGDVMDQVTDSWAERNAQIRHDAAKTAQTQIREDIDAKRSDNSARDDYRKPEVNRADGLTNDDNREHYDDVDTHRPREETNTTENSKPEDIDHDLAETGNHDRDNVTEHETAETDTPPKSSKPADETPETALNVTPATGETIPAENTTAQPSDPVVDPNMAAIPAVSPATVQVTDQNAVQTAGTNIPASSTQSGNGAQIPAQSGNVEGTTDGLMSSTALSQPAAGAAAKSALNGIDGSTEIARDNDSFLSKIVDAMSGERTVKSGSEAAQATNGNNTANANSGAGTQTAANATPANTTGQAAQQAMAGAANLQNMPPVAQPQTATTSNATSTVSATGATDGTVQAGNGQLSGNSNLTQGNASGQAAHTARSAPAQQVQQQVAVHIRNAASDGVEKISVQLRPEHLGRVDVKLEISHDGRVQGVIQADTRETLDMLRQDSRALQQALKDAGLNADSQSFTFEHRNEGGQSQEGNGQSRMANNSGSTPDEGDVMSGAELAEHVAIGYGINPNGLVDIRI